MLNDGLRDILQKQAVVHTKFSEQLISEPQEVEYSYNLHVHTHVPLGDTDSFVKRVIDRVQHSKTSKGAIIAPWGYGKTSTMVFAWKACEESGILAVPPFACATLHDILDATYGWTRFRLGRDRHVELDNIYHSYAQSAFAEQVKTYARETGVAESDARAILDRLRKDGKLVLELTPVNMCKYLEDITNLIIRDGEFQGLVLFIDELQNFFDKTNNLRATLESLREIVTWLATHNNLKLGVILCLPDTHESIVYADILDRLRVDKLYFNLRNIYGSNFPEQLWEQFVDRYHLGDLEDKVISKYALQAIGQIAAREDLGRGPRTVIDALQCAIRHYDKTGETYSPINLIDDFIQNHMSFDSGQFSNAGQVHTIRSAVEDALNVSIVKTAFQRTAVKLWAAFPEHGCSDEVLRFYGVATEAEKISHEAHGDLLTYQSTGYTLRRLASYTPGGDGVERIAREFWRTYSDEDPQWLDYTQKAFVSEVLSGIFDSQWSKLNFQPNEVRGLGARIIGSFNRDYPKRVVDIQIAYESSGIEIRKSDSDIQFDFILSRDLPDAGGKIENVNNDKQWLRITLNLNNHALAGEQLPRDLFNLRSSLNPKRLTPQLMLSFVSYAKQWPDLGESNRLSQGDQNKVTAICGSMTTYANNVLFNDDLRTTFSPRLQSTNVQIVRELFSSTLKAIYPDYVSLLAVGDESLRHYVDALGKLSLNEKRGRKAIDERRKLQIANLFGLTAWSTFDTKIRGGYASLMKCKEARKDEAEITLLLHPLESTLLKILENSGGTKISPREFLEIANIQGYRDAEAVIVSKLLIARELVQINASDKTIVRMAAGPSSSEVEKRLASLKKTVDSLPDDLINLRDKNSLLDQARNLNRRFSPELDEEILEEINIEIKRAENSLDEILSKKQRDILSEIEAKQRTIDEIKREFSRPAIDLEGDIPSGLDFRRILLDMQSELRKERRFIQKEVDNLLSNFNRVVQKTGADATIERLTDILEARGSVIKGMKLVDDQIIKFKRNISGFTAWLKLLRMSDELYKSLESTPDLRIKLTDDIVRQIMQNFARRKFDALAEDAEKFQVDFDELAKQRDSWVTTKREEFQSRKDALVEWLKKLGAERPNFSARYDHLEHEQSYEEMYNQVHSIATQYVAGMQNEFSTARLDIKRARQIQWDKLEKIDQDHLKKVEHQYNEIEIRYKAELKRVKALIVRETEQSMLDEIAQHISLVSQDIQKIIEEARKYLRPLDAKTDNERAVLDLLHMQKEVDLTDLILKSDKSLQEIMDGLVGLYQGNQIILRVARRS